MAVADYWIALISLRTSGWATAIALCGSCRKCRWRRTVPTTWARYEPVSTWAAARVVQRQSLLTLAATGRRWVAPKWSWSLRDTERHWWSDASSPVSTSRFKQVPYRSASFRHQLFLFFFHRLGKYLCEAEAADVKNRYAAPPGPTSTECWKIDWHVQHSPTGVGGISLSSF